MNWAGGEPHRERPQQLATHGARERTNSGGMSTTDRQRGATTMIRMSDFNFNARLRAVLLTGVFFLSAAVMGWSAAGQSGRDVDHHHAARWHLAADVGLCLRFHGHRFQRDVRRSKFGGSRELRGNHLVASGDYCAHGPSSDHQPDQQPLVRDGDGYQYCSNVHRDCGAGRRRSRQCA